MDKQTKSKLSRIVEESLSVNIEFHSGVLSRITPATVSGSNGAYVAKKTQMLGDIDVCVAVGFSDRDVHYIFQDNNMFTIWLIG